MKSITTRNQRETQYFLLSMRLIISSGATRIVINRKLISKCKRQYVSQRTTQLKVFIEMNGRQMSSQNRAQQRCILQRKSREKRGRQRKRNKERDSCSLCFVSHLIDSWVRTCSKKCCGSIFYCSECLLRLFCFMRRNLVPCHLVTKFPLLSVEISSTHNQFKSFIYSSNCFHCLCAILRNGFSTSGLYLETFSANVVCSILLHRSEGERWFFT